MPIANRLIKKYWYPLVYSRPVSKLAQKAWYPISTRLMATDELQFMNWAYEEDPPMALQLAPSDQRNRLFIQLYHRVATQADLTGKQVLEVGCGHGGGASYLVRTLHPASYMGLDLNAAGIEFCRKKHQLPGLDFIQGNAEELPFPDKSFNVVLNVESSHLYARFPLFLTEVARVLRPGGYFLYTDVRKRQLVSEWEEALAAAPLRKISEKVIDKEVMRGLEKTQRMMGLVSHRLPGLLRSLGHHIDRMQTATFYHALDSGEYSYRLYCFVKDVEDVEDVKG